MSDDLVTRLRRYPYDFTEEAADRIEQLEAALRDASGIAKVAWMEATLGTLGDADYGCELCEWIAEAIDARAALEGKD